MATTIWQSVDGDWGAAASWTNGVPGPGADVAVLSGVSQVPVAANLDQAGDDLGLIYISPKYKGDIGGPGNPLKLGAAKIIHRGQGVLYLAATTNDVDNLIINVSHKRVACVLSASTNTVARLRVQRGRCIAGGKLSLIEVATGGICDVAPDTDNLDYVLMTGGRLTHNRANCTSVTVLDGRYEQRVGSLGALFQMGGRVVYSSSNATGAAFALTWAYILGGTLDLLDSLDPKTVTHLHQWPDAVVHRNDDIVTVGTVYDMTGEPR